MKKIVLVCSLLLSTVIADELVEPVEEVQVSAVSKVMERFSKLSTIESTPIEDTVEEQTVETTTLVTEEEVKNLEPAQIVKTAKFESKDVPYPKDKKVTNETVQTTEIEKTAETKEKSLKKAEEHAKKVIEEEMKKVEEAKETALKRINEAMKRVEEAKSSQSDF